MIRKNISLKDKEDSNVQTVQMTWAKERREGNELTQGISLAILVRDGEHTHHLVPLLPQVAVHLLAEQALANDCQFELILVVALSREQTQTR